MSERWKPAIGEWYYFVSSTGNVLPDIFDNDNPSQVTRCNRGNCFPCQEIAEVAAKKFRELLLSLYVNGTSTANSETLKGTFIEHLKKCAEIQADVILQKARERNAPEETKLPKLTAEVFDRPDCPTWAKYAMVNDLGDGCWYEENPGLFYAGYGHGTRIMFIDRFDATDWQNSLIERPEKKTLPDWCKVGEWVYADGKGGYGKVYEIKDYIRVKMENGRSVNQISEYKINELSRARHRPFNTGEMIALVGKAVKMNSFIDLVLSYDLSDCTCATENHSIVTAEYLAENATFPDGKPCYVLEHLENGEWVK